MPIISARARRTHLQTFDTSTALHWTARSAWWRRQETMHTRLLQIQLLQYLAIYLGFAPHTPVSHTLYIDDLLEYFMMGFTAPRSLVDVVHQILFIKIEV